MKQLRENTMSFENGATFSPCRGYRYSLWRDRQPGVSYALFICLNPSTANEKINDQTIKRCTQFAKDWKRGGFIMVNLFALRERQPKKMKAHPEPVGLRNDEVIQELARDAGVIVCAWGGHGSHRHRDRHVETLLAKYELMCLEKNMDGSPRHPLFVKADSPLKIYRKSTGGEQHEI